MRRWKGRNTWRNQDEWWWWLLLLSVIIKIGFREPWGREKAQYITYNSSWNHGGNQRQRLSWMIFAKLALVLIFGHSSWIYFMILNELGIQISYYCAINERLKQQKNISPFGMDATMICNPFSTVEGCSKCLYKWMLELYFPKTSYRTSQKSAAKMNWIWRAFFETELNTKNIPPCRNS